MNQRKIIMQILNFYLLTVVSAIPLNASYGISDNIVLQSSIDNYLINDINQLYHTPAGKLLVNDANNNFHEKPTGLNYKSRDGKLYKYEFKGSKIERTSHRDYIQGACIDMTTGSGGNLGQSLQGTFSASIEGDYAFKSSFFFYSSEYGVSLRASLLVSHSMSASCDVSLGFGRLLVAYTRARLPLLEEEEMIQINDIFVGTGNKRIVETPEFYDENSLVAICINSNEPC